MKIGSVVFLSMLFSINIFAEQDSTQQAYDYIPDANYAEIADRIECINTEIPLTFNKTVKSFIDYFSVRNRDYTRGVLEKKDYYFRGGTNWFSYWLVNVGKRLGCRNL